MHALLWLSLWWLCWLAGFPCLHVCSVVAADFTGGLSRVKGAFGVGFADVASLHP
jgi:hypothetical protein